MDGWVVLELGLLYHHLGTIVLDKYSLTQPPELQIHGEREREELVDSYLIIVNVLPP